MDVADLDLFSPDFLADPYPVHAALREAGGAVWLPRRGTWVSARYPEVQAALRDGRTFCSGRGVGIVDFRREPPWRLPSPLLEVDPPQHNRARRVVAQVLSPAAVRKLAGRFAAVAEQFVQCLANGEPFDAIADLATPYPLQVFGEAFGLPAERRKSAMAGARVVWNPGVPRVDLLDSPVPESGPSWEWIMENCGPAALLPGGMGSEVHRLAAAEGFAPREAALLVRTLLSAGVDTRVHALGNALWCLAGHPDQYARLQADPRLVPNAFEEVLRFESPAQVFFRTAARDIDLGGAAVPAGSKVMLLIGAANRDPHRWPAAGTFDVTRRTSGHLAFGFGIHACIGMLMARLEAKAVLGAVTRHVSAIEPAGEPKRMVHSTLRGFQHLPLRFVPR